MNWCLDSTPVSPRSTSVFPLEKGFVVKVPFSQDSMRKLIENSSVPLLVTERNSIAMANRAARRMLGHVAHAVTAWEAVADSLQLGRKDREQLRDLFESDGILAEARRESGRSHVGRYRATDSPGT